MYLHFHLHLKYKLLTITTMIMKNKIKGVFIWEKATLVIHPTTNTSVKNAILQNNSQLYKKMKYRAHYIFFFQFKIKKSLTHMNA